MVDVDCVPLSGIAGAATPTKAGLEPSETCRHTVAKVSANRNAKVKPERVMEECQLEEVVNRHTRGVVKLGRANGV